jgi:hypothetical protein
MIDKDNLPAYTFTTSFHSYAWESLTEKRQISIITEYEIKEGLKNRTGSKRDVYRAVADKVGCISWQRIEEMGKKIKIT